MCSDVYDFSSISEGRSFRWENAVWNVASEITE